MMVSFNRRRKRLASHSSAWHSMTNCPLVDPSTAWNQSLFLLATRRFFPTLLRGARHAEAVCAPARRWRRYFMESQNGESWSWRIRHSFTSVYFHTSFAFVILFGYISSYWIIVLLLKNLFFKINTNHKGAFFRSTANNCMLNISWMDSV